MMTQSQALDLLRTGRNIFLTGEPGSGKTFTIGQYVRWLRDRGISRAITASTGIAATHIGGVTVHSWSGIGVSTDIDAARLRQIADNPLVAGRVRRAKVLIIDEVSMLSAPTLDAVDAVCRSLRGDPRAFGGLQVVFVGDFFQLPPVRSGERDDAQLSLHPRPPSALEGFAFSSSAWQNAQPTVCYLAEQHRQDDADFLGLLAALRNRTVSRSERSLLEARSGHPPAPGAVLLFSHNADVDRINEAELAKIPGDAAEFEMTARGPEALVAALTRGCTSPARLLLKRGAKVVFTRNDSGEGRWANGTLGVVVGFDDEDGLPIVRAHNGARHVVEPVEWTIDDGERVLAGVRQLPLRLAWAITVHKSQGMSLDAAHVDLSRAFEYGQGYVALSRVRNLAGLSLVGFNARALEVHPDVVSQDDELREASSAARDALKQMKKSAVDSLHADFVRACGGRVSQPAPRGAFGARRKKRR